jgi:hypothetical protein
MILLDCNLNPTINLHCLVRIRKVISLSCVSLDCSKEVIEGTQSYLIKRSAGSEDSKDKYLCTKGVGRFKSSNNLLSVFK